jgi:hypothetical protein
MECRFIQVHGCPTAREVPKGMMYFEFMVIHILSVDSYTVNINREARSPRRLLRDSGTYAQVSERSGPWSNAAKRTNVCLAIVQTELPNTCFRNSQLTLPLNVIR